MKTAILTILLLIGWNATPIFAQERIAVLPFRNMDGLLTYAPVCSQLSDSLAIAMQQNDPEMKTFFVVPADTVNEVLASLNLDPQNPQYESDLWQAVKMLKISRVITGAFNAQSGNLMVNAYIYDVETKLQNGKHQAKNLYRKAPDILEIIPKIVKKLLPAFSQH